MSLLISRSQVRISEVTEFLTNLRIVSNFSYCPAGYLVFVSIYAKVPKSQVSHTHDFRCLFSCHGLFKF